MKCAGYRDQLALLFRDENARTQHRSVTAKDRSRQAETCWNKIQVDQLSLAATPSKSLDEGGLSFFLDRFTTAPQWSSIDQSSMSVTVHPFIKSIVAKEQTRDALISVGLAALSNVTGDKACLKVALQKYVNGIKHVREALEEPTKTDLDDTLKLAVILALFELVSTSPGHLNSWNIHTNGALALFRHLHHGRMPVKPRNMADLQSYTFFILKYFTSGGDIPSEILDWAPPNYSSQILNTAAALISILVRFVRYSAVLQDSTFNMNTEEAVRAALLIDTALNDWEASLFSDDSWSYVTQESSELFGVYQGKCHVYKNIWASRILNHYRWARIRVNELLYLYTSKLMNPTASQLVHQQTALSTISRMATDICISVPNHCRLMGFGFGSLASREADVPPLNGVFILVFPLIIAGSAIGVSDELHEWIVKTLGMIGSTMGIGHAAESISVVKTIREVKKRQDVVSWNAALIFPMHG